MNIMIDFETFAVSNKAAVASLGFAVFTRENIIDSGGWTINVASSLLAGGEVDPDTMDWWKSQSVEAKSDLIHGGICIENVLVELTSVWERHKCKAVWAHGATFDIPIAEFYFKGSQPWRYSQHRDTRTLFDIAHQNGWERLQRSTSHLSSQDAYEQAEDAIKAMRWLKQWLPSSP